MEQPCAWRSGAEITRQAVSLSRARKCSPLFQSQNMTAVVLLLLPLAIVLTHSRVKIHPFSLNVGVKQVVHLDE